MIPLQLTLKHFLSYREATLDFRGLHVACICGPNGAGKSSLLEAIAWAVWGQSRTSSEDDLIHLGAREAKVDFIFQSRQQIYRVIRSRQRGQATTLEFQVAVEAASRDDRVDPANPTHFRSLTERGVRATQQLLLNHLKLDYDTFIHSAYLRQGRADEFMLKRPSERKQILADLLNLNQYDRLAEQAKDRAREFKAQIDVLSPTLQAMQTQWEQQAVIQQEATCLQTQLTDLQQQQTSDRDTLQRLQAEQHQRQVWFQQLTWQQQQQNQLMQDCQRLQTELQATQQQQQQLETLLQQEAAIQHHYQQFQAVQLQEEALAAKAQVMQQAQTKRQQLQRQQEQQIRAWQDQLWQLQTQTDLLQQQAQEHQKVLSKANDLESALEHLQQARTQLAALDQLQAQVSPLLQRRHQIQTQLDRAQIQLTARLEALQTSLQQLQQDQQHQPHLQEAVAAVATQIAYLESRRAYQQQVREKGLERRHFMERLQVRQRELETQLAKLDQKAQLLKQPDASCPLCDRPLDEPHWTLVLQRHQAEQETVLNQIWVLREQLIVSEREIQILRQEYRDLDHELAQYGGILERRGQLQEQLQVTQAGQQRFQQIWAEKTQLERQLQAGDYAADLQEELWLIDRELHRLWGEHPYDERTHALVRGEVDRWRWAEIKQTEIKQARKRQAQIDQRLPELQTQIAQLQAQIAAGTCAEQSPTQRQLEAIDRALSELGYDPEQHQTLRQTLRQLQPWQLRYHELTQAQLQYPQVQQRQQDLAQAYQARSQQLQAVTEEIEQVMQQLQQCPDHEAAIQTLEQQLQERRLCLDHQIAQLGRLQQQQQHWEALTVQQATLNHQLETARRQHRIYQELAQAFGRNGIQALMIENVLPQLEAETNRMLSRLSANQLHVQFVTQRASKTAKGHASSATAARLIDTLEILIADAHGTRPYETYSGGEGFRVNFAIRLALARLLMQRSGTALQLLIVDEGFGTQDAEGCDRLIAAINAIAPDFACILTVTHMPQFKAAFQVRIEVSKTATGSQLQLIL